MPYAPLGPAEGKAQQKSQVRVATENCCATFCGGLCLLALGLFVILYFSLQSFQAWSIQNPTNLVSRLYQPYINFIEGFWAMHPLYLDRQRMLYGETFMVAGQVVLGDFESIEKALTSPQARTTNLGASPLIPSHLPKRDNGVDLTFLLGLSDKDAGGTGDHEAFKQALDTVIFTHDAAARQTDATSISLLEGLAAEYEQASQEGPDGLNRFFGLPDHGWMRFNIRYQHYVLFGLDPDDDEATSAFTKAYYNPGGATYYIEPLGKFLSSVTPILDEVAQRYLESPAMKKHPGALPEYNFLTNRETARLAVAMFAIAAMQGPFQFGLRVMAHLKLPDLESAKRAGLSPPSAIDVGEKWDALDLEDDDAVERHLLELGRLYMPVSAVHRIATEPFTAQIAGADREFPAGTVVNVPMSLAMMDPTKWGDTRYDYDPNRVGLKDFSMLFNEVGSRHAGRACPGKSMSMTMMIDVVQHVGNARRKVLSATP